MCCSTKSFKLKTSIHTILWSSLGLVRGNRVRIPQIYDKV